MSDVGRFGVFLPVVHLGGRRRRSAPAASRRSRARVEELGFDCLFITDHLLAAKRFYSVNWLEPLTTLAVAAGATERVRLGTSILIMPLRNPVHPRQGARDAPVPVRQPGHPRRRRRLERRRVRGGRRPQVGARQAHRRDARHHDAAARGRAGHATTAAYYSTSTTCSSSRGRRSGRCCGSAAARSSRTRSRRTCRSSSSRSRRAPSRPTAGSPARPARRRTSPATGRSSRSAMREAGRDPADCLVAHENFLHLVLTNDPAKAREEQHRAFLKVMSSERGPGVPRVGLPVRDAGRDHRLAPGAGGRRRRVLLPAHDDARPGASSSCGSTRSSPTSCSRATVGPVRRPADAVAPMTRRVALLGKPLKRRHSQVMHDAAFAAAGIDARYVLRELEPDEVEAAVAAARGADWLGLGVTAPVQAGRRRPVDEVEPDATDDRRGQQRRPHDDGRLVGFNTDAPGFRAGVELAMGRPLAGADGRRRRRRRRGACRRLRLPRRAGARRVTVGNRTGRRGAPLAARFARVGSGSTRAVVPRRRRVRRRARRGRPRGQRDDRRDDRSRA